MDAENLLLTKITAHKPPRLSKGFALDAEGKLVKQPGGTLSDGIASRETLHNIADLAELLEDLTPQNALVYGLSPYETARVVSRKMLAEVKHNGGPPLITRTREFFSFSTGQAAFMLDYDLLDGEPGLSSTDFRKIIYEVVPAIEKAPHLLMASASSFIYHGKRCLRGESGKRMLIVVSQGSDIPRAGDALFKRLWLAGYGHIGISRAGSLLVRALIDSSVWQPERLDFCGGAYCEQPLEQRRPRAIVVNGDAEPLDSSAAIPSLSLAEEAHYRELVSDSRKGKEGRAAAVRQAWIEKHVADHMQQDPQADAEKILEVYTQAVTGGQLLGGFILHPSDGGAISVAEVLADPDEWHGRRFSDPLEPDYRNDSRIAFLNLKAAGRPYLYSNAHGGKKFFLLRQRVTVRIIPGERVRATEEALAVLRKDGQHYNRGGEIVMVSRDSEVLPRDEKAIGFDLDQAIRFERYDSRRNVFTPCDCKPSIASGVMAARREWGLPRLTGISSSPILNPLTDRVISSDGYNAETGLLICLPDPTAWEDIPDKPTDNDVERSVRALWTPFESFPFDGPTSKGVWLGTVLCAAIRTIIPTAPATAITSPVAGSGKTLLAKAAGEIIGETPALLLDARDNEEIRKRLLSLLRTGKRLLILDNVTTTLDSSALCTLLTSETYQDRVLGATEIVCVPTRTLVLITGNNLSLRGDLCRRVITTRIDPQTETPWKRKFSVDPVTYCRDHRLLLVRAALIILRAGIQRGPDLPDRTASFELWSDTVRRAVVFVGNHDMLDVDDPILSIDAAYEMDPETTKLTALLEAWSRVFGSRDVTVAEVISASMDGYEAGNNAFSFTHQDLHDAVADIAQTGRTFDARIFAWWLRRNRERIIEGRKIVVSGEHHRAKRWCVKAVG